MRGNKHIIEIYPNGDPYGGGFQGSESTDGGETWFFLGGMSPMSRERWRSHCRRNKITLRHRY